MSLTIVQAVAASDNPTDGSHPTFHVSGPTNGNLMIAMIYVTPGITPAAQNGWTESSYNFNGTTNAGIGIYYKYAGASESTTQVPDSNTASPWEACFWEISGVTGTWATDHVLDTIQNTIVYPGVSGTTPSFNTTDNNELILGFFGANSAGPNFSLASSAYTQDATSAATAGSVGAYALGIHAVEGSSGTAISTTITATFPSGTPGVNCRAGWVELAGGVPPSTETGNVSLALSKVSFNAEATHVGTTGTGTLALSGVSIAAAAYDLNSLNPIRQFSTFG